MSEDVAAVRPLPAPVLIVTPHGFGLGGKQPRGGTLRRSRRRSRGRPKATPSPARPSSPSGVSRRLSGHPLPERIPPAEQNLRGILGTAASRDPETPGSPWLIAPSSRAPRSSQRCSSPRTGASCATPSRYVSPAAAARGVFRRGGAGGRRSGRRLSRVRLPQEVGRGAAHHRLALVRGRDPLEPEAEQQ